MTIKSFKLCVGEVLIDAITSRCLCCHGAQGITQATTHGEARRLATLSMPQPGFRGDVKSSKIFHDPRDQEAHTPHFFHFVIFCLNAREGLSEGFFKKWRSAIHLHIFTSSHPHIFTTYHLDTFTSKHLHIFTS